MPSDRVRAILAEWAESAGQLSLSLGSDPLNADDWNELLIRVDRFKPVNYLTVGAVSKEYVAFANAFTRCLPKLAKLVLRNVQSGTLGRMIEGLDLVSLDLGWCKQVGDEGLQAVAAGLPTLTALYLWGCEWVGKAELRTVATGLPALTTLNLRGCGQVTNEGLRAIAERYRERRLPQLRRLDLRYTHVSLPAEVLESEDAGVILRHMLAEGKRPIGEAKLLLLGDGEVGKSHLRDRLCGDRHAYDALKGRTPDIHFTLLEAAGRRPRTRLWDFGGQPYLHGSHRFFLGADHAAYVLVLDATRTAAANHLRYWLRFIARHGTSVRRGERAPVVVVVNKCDTVALAADPAFADRPGAAEVRERHADLHRGLEEARAARWYGANVIDDEPIFGLGYLPAHVEKYGNDETLKKLLQPVSGRVPGPLHAVITAAHERALDAVNAAVTAALRAVPTPASGYEPAFHQLKAYLEEILSAADPAVMTPWVDVGTPAWREKVNDTLGVLEADTEVWLRALQSLGVLHWVGEFDPDGHRNHPTIRSRLFNPHWVVTRCYQLFRDLAVRNAGARTPGAVVPPFRVSDCDDEQHAVEQLMLACKVVFPVRDRDTGDATGDLLVPDRLQPDPRPDEAPSADALRWRLDVPFLSDRVLLRFIGDHYEHVAHPDRDCCRNRVEFAWPDQPGCVVRVTSELEGRGREWPHLRVTVAHGPQDERKDAARAVWRELVRVLQSEGLLQRGQAPSPIDENQAPPPETRDEWLRWYIQMHADGKWLSESEARELHEQRTRGSGASPESWRRYRTGKLNETFHIDRLTAGVTQQGYVWRKANDRFEYLEDTLNAPLKPPYPPAG